MGKLQAIDLEASYGITADGSDKHLIDLHGTRRLNSRCWELGREALALLTKATTPDGGDAPTIGELVDALPTLEKEGAEFLASAFYPTLLELFDAGVMVSNVDRAGLEAAWREYEFPDRVELLAQTLDANPLALSQAPEFVPFVQTLAAIAVLRWLDDAIMAEFCDGNGLPTLIAGLERLAPHLRVPSNLFAAFDTAKRMALSENAATLAGRKHAPMNRAREWVAAEWRKHAGDYDGNKSAFARDYSRLVAQRFTTAKGDPLTVTDKQIRDVWLRKSSTQGANAGEARL